jgi:hypothetical protein
MNPFLVPTLVVAAGMFVLGLRMSSPGISSGRNLILMLAGLAFAAPAILFVVFYTGIFGEATWFYTFRSWPGTELTAGGAGWIAGWLQAKRNQKPRVRKYVSAGFISFLLLLGVMIPYLKPIFLRPDWNDYADHWSNEVCLQSSESSCGPASAATLLHLAGETVTEKQIARESFTSRRGTENWYLIRTLRRHGLLVNYLIGPPEWTNLPYPAIIGVRIGGIEGTGHFIAVLDKVGDEYVVGDPMRGREQLGMARLLDHYYFTGFSIIAHLPNHGKIAMNY